MHKMNQNDPEQFTLTKSKIDRLKAWLREQTALIKQSYLFNQLRAGRWDMASVALNPANRFLGINVTNTLLADNTALITVAKRCNQPGATSMLARLIRWGADVNQANENGDVALNWLAYRGDAAQCKILMDAKANVHVVSKDTNVTPLRAAVHSDDPEKVKVLLTAAEDEDADTVAEMRMRAFSGHLKFNALHVAARHGKSNAIKAMLAFTPGGGTLDLRCNKDKEEAKTAMMLAVDNGHFDIAMALHAAGANLSLPHPRSKEDTINTLISMNSDASDACLYAMMCQDQQHKKAAAIVSQPQYADASDTMKLLALFLLQGNKKAVRLLAEIQGASLETETLRALLRCAVNKNLQEGIVLICDKLQQFNINSDDIVDEKGNTLLFNAVMNPNQKGAEGLIASNASLFTKNNTGVMPIHHACNQNITRALALFKKQLEVTPANEVEGLIHKLKEVRFSPYINDFQRVTIVAEINEHLRMRSYQQLRRSPSLSARLEDAGATTHSRRGQFKSPLEQGLASLRYSLYGIVTLATTPESDNETGTEADDANRQKSKPL